MLKNDFFFLFCTAFFELNLTSFYWIGNACYLNNFLKKWVWNFLILGTIWKKKVIRMEEGSQRQADDKDDFQMVQVPAGEAREPAPRALALSNIVPFLKMLQQHRKYSLFHQTLFLILSELNAITMTSIFFQENLMITKDPGNIP